MRPNVRNVGVMAHVDAGKTTLTERMLFNAGRIHKPGDVHTGNTEMDSHSLEKKHGITIRAASTSFDWRNVAITLIDTPGHVDFTIEVERSLRVLDGAVAVFSAVAGVEPQSETVWRQADRFNVPRLSFVNKMDQTGADFARTVDMIADRLGARPLPIQLPIGAESRFTGVIDLVTMRALRWDARGAAPRIDTIPDDMRAEAHAWRLRLVETLSEVDDDIIGASLEDAAHVDAHLLAAAIRKACLADRLTPVLCGSAYRNIGVEPLLDAVAAYAPAPTDRPPVEGVDPRTGQRVRRSPRADQPFTALVSKIRASRFGTLALVRVYAGRAYPGMRLVNAATGAVERIGRLMRMHADEATDTEEACAGDVIAVLGLKSARAGATLSDPDHPIVLDGFAIPDPVIEATIEPRGRADAARLSQAIALMARADPSLRFSSDGETGLALVRGMGELHLQICVETLKEDFGIEAVLGAPQIAYRTAPSQRAEVDHTLRKQSGGPGRMARVRLVLEPLAQGESGLVFIDRTAGGAIPKDFVPAIEKALRQAMVDGGSSGTPVLGLKAILVDGAFHERDSSTLAFEMATREAFRLGYEQTKPIVLEPVMRVVVLTPGDYLGALIGDLQRRRGQILSAAPLRRAHELVAEAPLTEMFNYVSSLRSLSQGRANFTMSFARYAVAPKALQEKAITT